MGRSGEAEHEHLPNEAYQADANRAIEAARAAIAEGLRLIAAREDGPFTMHCQIKEIDERVDDIERQVRTLSVVMDQWERVATRLTEQRDEAVRQRDLLMGFIERLYEGG